MGEVVNSIANSKDISVGYGDVTPVKIGGGKMLAYIGWSAPIEWSSLNVNALSAAGLSGRRFRALVDGIPMRCAA
jgi:hypothetical protein